MFHQASLVRPTASALTHDAIAACLFCLAWLSASASAKELDANDIAWLNRVTYGADTATISRYEILGKTGFLDEQLSGKTTVVPAETQSAIDRLGINDLTAGKADQLYKAAAAHSKTLEGQEKRKAQADMRRQRREFSIKTDQRNLLRAVYSPQQIREQMVWFWLNHFSVYGDRGAVGWYAPSYSEEAIAPHALGKFRDLVMATLEHPAMLIYLDNARNVKGHVNENYALLPLVEN